MRFSWHSDYFLAAAKLYGSSCSSKIYSPQNPEKKGFHSNVWHPTQTEHTSKFLSCSIFPGVFDCSGLVLVYSDGFSTAASGKRYWKREKQIHMYINQKYSSEHVHMWNHFNVLINQNLKSGVISLKKNNSFLMYHNCLIVFQDKNECRLHQSKQNITLDFVIYKP